MLFILMAIFKVFGTWEFQKQRTKYRLDTSSTLPLPPPQTNKKKTNLKKKLFLVQEAYLMVSLQEQLRAWNGWALQIEHTQGMINPGWLV